MELPFNPKLPFVLLEQNLSDDGPSLLFTKLAKTVSADASTLSKALDEVRDGVASGLWAAGWLGYEAGYGFEDRLANLPPPTASLLWFGLFHKRERLNGRDIEALWRSPVATPVSARITDIKPLWTEDAYRQRFERAQAYIRAGDIYQINLTFPAVVNFEGEPLALFKHLRENQRVKYSALINTGDEWVLSFSPELFFELTPEALATDPLLASQRRLGSTVLSAETIKKMEPGLRRDDSQRNNHILTRPMKGTAPRSNIPAEDKQLAEMLHNDPKNRAENLMIVDLLRNDLSKIATPGSVHTHNLYTIESYATVHQMTSGVSADLTDGLGAVDIMKALFPCGSVTGAPKIRAMEIIHELESQPRQQYCGSIGYLGPDGNAVMNVAIRTLSITAPGKATLGLGSAIIADSVAADEYAECLLKSRFLTQQTPPFDLIETMRFEPDKGYWLLDEHLERLEASANRFGFVPDLATWKNILLNEAKTFTAPMRVRLVVSRTDSCAIHASALPLVPDKPVPIIVAEDRMNSNNLFLYHKTSHRDFYDAPRKRLQKKTECFDCIFMNERTEITEGSFTSLFIKRGGKLYTPPLKSGVLPGIFRKHLLETGQACEAVIWLNDIHKADAFFVGNAVRGLLPAKLKVIE